MRQVESRLFVALVGGAAGTFASLGDRAPELQVGIAKRFFVIDLGNGPFLIANPEITTVTTPSAMANNVCAVVRASGIAADVSPTASSHPS